MKNKIPPPIVFLLFAIAMWFVAQSAYAYPITIPFALIIAIGLAATGLLIAVTATRQFSSVQTTINPLKPDEATTLVDSGIFAKTRNPMYLGLFLFVLAWAVWLQSAANILLLLTFVVFITNLQIKPEEEALRKVFGQTYTDYCKRVRRWI